MKNTVCLFDKQVAFRPRKDEGAVLAYLVCVQLGPCEVAIICLKME